MKAAPIYGLTLLISLTLGTLSVSAAQDHPLRPTSKRPLVEITPEQEAAEGRKKLVAPGIKELHQATQLGDSSGGRSGLY